MPNLWLFLNVKKITTRYKIEVWYIRWTVTLIVRLYDFNKKLINNYLYNMYWPLLIFILFTLEKTEDLLHLVWFEHVWLSTTDMFSFCSHILSWSFLPRSGHYLMRLVFAASVIIPSLWWDSCAQWIISSRCCILWTFRYLSFFVIKCIVSFLRLMSLWKIESLVTAYSFGEHIPCTKREPLCFCFMF